MRKHRLTHLRPEQMRQEALDSHGFCKHQGVEEFGSKACGYEFFRKTLDPVQEKPGHNRQCWSRRCINAVNNNATKQVVYLKNSFFSSSVFTVRLFRKFITSRKSFLFRRKEVI